MNREIFIGDVQGCCDELMDLLDELAWRPERDRLFFVGDTINRGPKSAAVLDFLLEHPAARSVLGNHEWHLLNFANFRAARAAPGFRRTALQLKPRWDEYLRLIKAFPAFIESRRWLLVHGGLRPGLHPKDTPVADLVHLREIEIERQGRAVREPWYDHYAGRKLVIFGHWAQRGLVNEKRVRGLDSGCVYGGSLSALVLPEDRIISVPSRHQYYDPVKKKELW